MGNRLEYLKKKLDHCKGRIHDAETEDREIRKIICDEFSEFKVNDMVVVHRDGKQKRGIIYEVNYSPESSKAINGFTYVVFSVRKGETQSDNFRLVHYSAGDRIERFEEKDEQDVR